MGGLDRLRWETGLLVERVAEWRAGIRDHRPPLPVPRDRPLVVVGPHLDDAVLSCGQLLAGSPGSSVVTVFTAGPERWTELTEWDRSCGFRVGDDVMAARKSEDERALALLGAEPIWLDLVEGQYRRESAVAVTTALGDALTRWDDADVVVPLGISHADHLVVADAAGSVAARRRDLRWWVYADQPYASLFPDELAGRLASRGIGEPGRPSALGDHQRKRAAVHRYRSQLRPLRGSLAVALRPERTWVLPQRQGGAHRAAMPSG